MSVDDKTERKVDLRGLVCPEPVLRTKKLLDDASIEKVEALVDGEVNVNNLNRLARSLKMQFASTAKDGNFTVTIERKKSATDATSAVDSSSSHAHADPASMKASSALHTEVGNVVFLGKDKFGDGDPEFSTTLLNMFLQTMFESGQRPRALLMANTGVRLMTPDSPALKVLNDFKEAGCDVLACGLCVEFYGLKGKIPVEQITNMFAICEYIFAADKVISP
ncbi:MAG: sulfurtransferase-like selenium metabolism protein YedF [Candidatus Melainabacteria bacterium]|nr:sulfurtransferase-like selenium metabolism protein YedF [Candidatus Melainabacteria bacterium]